MNSEKLAVIGQGYVGLPIAMRGVDAGFTVVGLDVDPVRVRSLANGHSFVEDVPDAAVAAALADHRYLPTTDASRLDGFDYAVITVPTPLKESVPDLTFIEQAVAAIGPHVRPGCVVVLESTTYPGTTDEMVVPQLESMSGLKAGTDFFVGYSPERIDPGNKVHTFTSTPKVVAGVDQESCKRVESFYRRLVDTVVPVSGTREAELTKLLENTFRHVNIALVNELAVFAHELDIDIWEVIEAAGTKPFGFMKFTPGPGVGGHCLPVDPSYLSWQVRRSLGRNFRFVELANDVNDHMPEYVVQRLMLSLNEAARALKGSRVLAVGLSYKKNTGDPRESPAMRVVELLHQFGASVVGADPHIEPHLLPEYLDRVEFNREEVQAADAVVLLTDHDSFDYSILESAAGVVLDTRNRLHGRVQRL